MANYAYLSDGTKLSATDAEGNGLFRFFGISQTGQQPFAGSAAFSSGRFATTDNGMEPHYFLTDHLGSGRAVVDTNGEVDEYNDYYTFGLRWDNPIRDIRQPLSLQRQRRAVICKCSLYGLRGPDV